MILNPFTITRLGGTFQSWCVIRSRKIEKGFERTSLGISAASFNAIAEEARRRPETLKESVCAIYPDQPRPVPEDILEIAVEMDKATSNGILLTVLIRRGHYLREEDILPSSISKYEIEEIEEDEPSIAYSG